MNSDILFKEFNKKICLSNKKKKRLKTHRHALRDKMRNYFQDKDWVIPQFHSQGSFPLGTNCNPIEGNDYDLDDGVYFVCPKSERKASETYHRHVHECVGEHTLEVKDKNTCVRVIYTDGHHIDLPCYWLEKDGIVPRLAHKSEGFIESDPVAFVKWVKEKISESKNQEQLRRVIRYLKAWKDFREYSNSNLRLPSGFILTILACNHYVQHDRDDMALKSTVINIFKALSVSFTCYRPTMPIDEELLHKYTKDTVIKEIGDLVDYSKHAVLSNCEQEASEYWIKIFGSRFPLGEKISNASKSSPINKAQLSGSQLIMLSRNYSYRQMPESIWDIDIRYTVHISAKFKRHNANTEFKKFNSGFPLEKNCEMLFTIYGNIPKSITVYWQVVNTGIEARDENSLRGEIFLSKNRGIGGLTQKEYTSYTGIHWIEGFVVKDATCIGKTGEFVVEIV